MDLIHGSHDSQRNSVTQQKYSSSWIMALRVLKSCCKTCLMICIFSPMLQNVVEQMDAASCTLSFREYWGEKREGFVKINVIISVIISLI